MAAVHGIPSKASGDLEKRDWIYVYTVCCSHAEPEKVTLICSDCCLRWRAMQRGDDGEPGAEAYDFGRMFSPIKRFRNVI
jgi:hypothetical protein